MTDPHTSLIANGLIDAATFVDTYGRDEIADTHAELTAHRANAHQARKWLIELAGPTIYDQLILEAQSEHSL